MDGEKQEEEEGRETPKRESEREGDESGTSGAGGLEERREGRSVYMCVRWCVRLRKEAASEQRGNKGLVSLLCKYYIAPGASTVDGAHNVRAVYPR